MRLATTLCLLLVAVGRDASRQAPTLVEYTLRIDSAGSPDITVAMRIHGAAPEFSLAMVAHPEYDDQYWRFLTELRGVSAGGEVRVSRSDSALWRVEAPPGDVTIYYRVRYPSAASGPRSAWKAFLTPAGGLIGGPHSFLYVVGSDRTPVTLAVSLPSGWRVTTGLVETSAGTYAAPNIDMLTDSPLMVGFFRSWSFEIAGTPHRISYFGDPGGVQFDTVTFRSNVERFAREAVRTMGRPPYGHFDFMFEDNAIGGLEHITSVTIGARSADLAQDPNAYLEQTAHEFFHTWNEVNVRPANWIGVRRAVPPPTAELWWSEGVTLYFADLLLRRAGLPTSDSTRLAHSARLIARYLANPSYAIVSPEQASRNVGASLGANGDYTPSIYTQGELLAVVLDLIIRDHTAARRSLDDVMRTLATRFTPLRGFTDRDVEQAVGEACDCDALEFFESSIRQARPIDYDRWFATLGLSVSVTRATALAGDGTPAPDTRVSATLLPGERIPRLLIWFPSTLWGRAGLHTGDRLVSWNGAPVADGRQFRAAVGTLRLGDTVRVVVRRDAGTFETTVAVTGYEQPSVTLVERADATESQRRRRERWAAGQ